MGEHTQTNGDPSRVHIADLMPYEVLRSTIVDSIHKTHQKWIPGKILSCLDLN